jgi:hypothetical protein
MKISFVETLVTVVLVIGVVLATVGWKTPHEV